MILVKKRNPLIPKKYMKSLFLVFIIMQHSLIAYVVNRKSSDYLR